MRGIRHEPIAPVRVALLALLMLSAWALAAAAAHAQERGPLVLAKASYFFVGGKIDTLARRQPDGRAHVCRVHDPAAAAPSLSDRDGARRQPDRHQLHRHPRRARRLGAIFRAPRLCGLCRRSGGARALGPLVAGARTGAAAALQFRRAALHRARALQAMAAGASAHAMAGRGQGRRPRLRSVLRLAVPLDRRASPSSRSSTATRWSRSSTRSVRRSCSPIPNPAPSAGRSPTRGRTWSRRWSRSSRAVRRCTTSRTSPRPTGSRTPERRNRRVSATSRSPTIRRSAPTPSSNSCARTPPTSPTWCAAGGSRSRRAACQPRAHSHRRHRGGGVVPRRLRSLHRRLSHAGRRADHAHPPRRCRRARQRPHADAREEQRRDRRRDRAMARSPAPARAAGGAVRR